MKIIAKNNEFSVSVRNGKFFAEQESLYSFETLDSLCRFLLKNDGEELLDQIFRLDEGGDNAPILAKTCYNVIELRPSSAGCKLFIIDRSYDYPRVKHFDEYKPFLRWNAYMNTRNGWNVLEAFAATLLG
jgi:hypothetical protein